MSQQTASSDLVANVQLAIQHHKNGNIEEAIRNYEIVIPKLAGKTKASLCGNVGALYMSSGEYEKARDHFMSSVDADPENASAHFNLAVVLTTKLGEHAKAIKHCGKAMKLDPNNHKALHLMGNIMQNIGRPEEAAKYFVAAENIALQTQEESLQARAVENATSQHALQKLAVFNTKVGDVLRTTVAGRDYVLECVSTSPLVFVIDNIIDETECEHIISRAGKLLEKSFVMGGEYQVSDSGSFEPLADAAQETEGAVDPALYRSSYNAWLSQDGVLNELQQRLAVVLGLPAAYLKTKSEELQVVRYGPGGQFKVHQDSSAFNSRLVTALLYLNTVNEKGDGVEGVRKGESEGCVAVQGGETWFPYGLSSTSSDQETQSVLSTPSSVEGAIEAALHLYEARDTTTAAGALPVCLPGLKVVPKRGRAVVFFNHLASGAIDPSAVHAGLPVQLASPEKGVSAVANVEKWVANYWVELDIDLLSQYFK